MGFLNIFKFLLSHSLKERNQEENIGEWIV